MHITSFCLVSFATELTVPDKIKTAHNPFMHPASLAAKFLLSRQPATLIITKALMIYIDEIPTLLIENAKKVFIFSFFFRFNTLMPSFFPTFHLPKTRQKNALSAADLEVPRNLTQDFDGSRAVESFIPRKFSVRHMPEIPAYNRRTGQVLRGKRIQSMPNTLAPPLPDYHKPDSYRHINQSSHDVPPPVPVKEKRYSSYNSSTTSTGNKPKPEQIPRDTFASIENLQSLLQNRSDHFRPRSYNTYYNSYKSDNHTRNVSAPPNNQIANFDSGTIGSRLNHSSTFEKAPYNDSRSTVGSEIYQNPELKASYMSSLYNFYLQGDCASSASSVYENDELKRPPEITQSEPLNTSLTRTSFKTIDFCLDSCADYDKSRFMIPAAETLQSKRFSASHIPSSAYMKQQRAIPIRAVSEQPQAFKKTAAHRWSYAPPSTQAIHKNEKKLPEIAPAAHRHSLDTNGFDYKARMRQSLQDPMNKNRHSGFKSPSSPPRAVSNPITQIRQILRG